MSTSEEAMMLFQWKVTDDRIASNHVIHVSFHLLGIPGKDNFTFCVLLVFTPGYIQLGIIGRLTLFITIDYFKTLLLGTDLFSDFTSVARR